MPPDTASRSASTVGSTKPSSSCWRARVGNVYVNRNMIGAVVGVQPFGGEGLSGTGPKAGGPLYLRRLATAPAGLPARDIVAARETAPSAATAVLRPLRVMRDWLAGQSGCGHLAAVCDTLLKSSPVGGSHTLPGPTGERNTYALWPRQAVLCIGDTREDLLLQLATVLAAGAHAIWLEHEAPIELGRNVPADVRAHIALDDSLRSAFDAALADAETVRAWSHRLAQRDGPIVNLQCAPSGARGAMTFSVERLLVERSLSVNTAAAGGNASLMTIG